MATIYWSGYYIYGYLGRLTYNSLPTGIAPLPFILFRSQKNAEMTTINQVVCGFKQ
jgi:hypothetical protein